MYIVTEADISYNAGKVEAEKAADEKYGKIIAEKDAIIAQLTKQLQAK